MYWIISFEIVFLVQDPSILVKIITSLFGVMVCSFITLFWTSPTIWLEFKHFLTILSRETIGVPIYVSLLRTMFVVVTCFVGRRVLDIDHTSLLQPYSCKSMDIHLFGFYYISSTFKSSFWCYSLGWFTKIAHFLPWLWEKYFDITVFRMTSLVTVAHNSSQNSWNTCMRFSKSFVNSLQIIIHNEAVKPIIQIRH